MFGNLVFENFLLFLLEKEKTQAFKIILKIY